MESRHYLDTELLESYINTFYGYGNYNAPYWFVGMEEGGGGTIDDVQIRLNVWRKRGESELEDLAEYHFAINMPELFQDDPKLQPTWNKLIRILMGIESTEPTLEAIKAYQRDSLGRIGGNTCLPELLPLPSRSTRDWLYGSHSQIEYLKNRAAYGKQLAEIRANHIHQRVISHKPKAVIFYSLNRWYMEKWKLIARIEFETLSVEGFKLHLGSNEHTIFAITSHPASKGITSEYFQQAGQHIAAKIASR